MAEAAYDGSESSADGTSRARTCTKTRFCCYGTFSLINYLKLKAYLARVHKRHRQQHTTSRLRTSIVTRAASLTTRW